MSQPQPLPGTFTCHRCGQRFDNQHVHRRRVRTGQTFTGRSWRLHSHTVSLCPDCNKKEARSTILRGFLYVAFFIGVIVLLVLFGVIPVTIN